MERDELVVRIAFQNACEVRYTSICSQNSMQITYEAELTKHEM